jgi:hypothetical protein
VSSQELIQFCNSKQEAQVPAQLPNAAQLSQFPSQVSPHAPEQILVQVESQLSAHVSVQVFSQNPSQSSPHAPSQSPKQE